MKLFLAILLLLINGCAYKDRMATDESPSAATTVSNRSLYPLLKLDFEALNANTTVDLSSYRRDITSVGGALFDAENDNTYFSIPWHGVGYLRVEETESLHLKSFTLEARVRIRGNSLSGIYSTIISKGQLGSSEGRSQNFQLMVRNLGNALGRIGFPALPVGNWESSAPEVGHENPVSVNDGEWHHLVQTNSYDELTSENVLNLYVDGVRVQTLTKIGVPAEASGPFCIGAWEISLNQPYGIINGDIDDVVIYDVPLTGSEIEAAYRAKN